MGTRKTRLTGGRAPVRRLITWLRRDHGIGPDAIAFVLALTLIGVPVVTRHLFEWPLRWLVLSPFMLGLLRNLNRIRTRSVGSVDGAMALLIVGYLGVLSFSYGRAIWDMRIPIAESADGWMVLLVTAIYAASAFLAAPTASEQARLRLAILGGLVTFLAVNLALHFSGISQPYVLYRKEFPAGISAWLGLGDFAELFPMARGINSFGALAAACAVMAGAVLLRRDRTRREAILALAGLALGLIGAVMTDVRAILAFVLLAIALVTLMPERLAGSLRALPVFPILVPMILLVCLSVIPPDWWQALGEGARRTASLSNREGIWQVVLNELRAFRPIHLIGFGYLGQSSSGVSQAYSRFFPAYIYTEHISAHNAFLQSMLETGYLGTGVLLGLLVATTGRLLGPGGRGLAQSGSRALIGLLVLVNLAGITESTWSPQFQAIHVCLLQVLVAGAVSPSRSGERAV